MTLKSRIGAFLRDETGAITVDFVVVVGGSMLMGYTVVTDVSRGTLNFANDIDSYLTAISELDLTKTRGQIVVDPDAFSNSSDLSAGTDGQTSSGGNPGNDKDVGNAGENPNGSGDWGSGSNGMSDGNNGTSGNSGSSGNGNSGNGNNGNGNGNQSCHRWWC
ncbi:hypothetical protein [uncultured Maritimibacter sp.]|jgi:hypothetical protein|uniref:hypothetical protein n=1 Tax=uncultured Maritimibacter sp. TaxID=991866 RepID=UPI000AA781EA|nr:hypothetical protein [uncultured Maritimibacter sp.]